VSFDMTFLLVVATGLALFAGGALAGYLAGHSDGYTTAETEALHQEHREWGGH
jgi:hypothetical protein